MDSAAYSARQTLRHIVLAVVDVGYGLLKVRAVIGERLLHCQQQGERCLSLSYVVTSGLSFGDQHSGGGNVLFATRDLLLDVLKMAHFVLSAPELHRCGGYPGQRSLRISNGAGLVSMRSCRR